MQKNKQTLIKYAGIKYGARVGLILLGMGWGAVNAMAAAAPTVKPPLQDYDTCVGLVGSEAEAALTYARNWEDAAGPKALAARHCEALALNALGRHQDAAIIMSEVALAMENAPPSDRAAAFAQVADAWSLAGNEKRARTAIDQALALDPNADYLMQRANIRALAKDWDGVRLDTGEVLAELPTAADALALRAVAYRNLGVLPAAMEDANRALDIAPHNLSALLERGRVKAAQHDMPGARADWKSVIAYADAMQRADDPRAVAAKTFLGVGDGEK